MVTLARGVRLCLVALLFGLSGCPRTPPPPPVLAFPAPPGMVPPPPPGAPVPPPTPVAVVALESATPTDAFIDACRAGQAPACVVAGLRYQRKADVDPPKRIGAQRLFERGCELGRGDACHAAGLLANPVDGLGLLRRACALGFKNGCERAEDLRSGGVSRSCEPGLVSPDRAVFPLPAGVTLPAPLPAGALVYPVEARAGRFEATVRLCVRVSPQGAVTETVVLDDAPVLGEAARASVSLWRFPPVPWNGVPHGFVSARTVVFRLE